MTRPSVMSEGMGSYRYALGKLLGLIAENAANPDLKAELVNDFCSMAYHYTSKDSKFIEEWTLFHSLAYQEEYEKKNGMPFDVRGLEMGLVVSCLIRKGVLGQKELQHDASFTPSLAPDMDLDDVDEVVEPG